MPTHWWKWLARRWCCSLENGKKLVDALIVSCVYGGLVYWMEFLASFKQLDHLGTLDDKGAQQYHGERTAMKDEEQF